MGNDAPVKVTSPEAYTFVLANQLATKAHNDQADKCGMPYIMHLQRVAHALSPDLGAMTVAILHDIIEDTWMTAEELRNLGIPEDIVDDVVTLTRLDSETHWEYVERICAGSDRAITVKVEDVRDNHSLWRFGLDLPEQYKTMPNRYVRTYRLLLEERRRRLLSKGDPS